MHMEMTFPGGLAVDAQYEGFTVPTDQPVHAGGGGTAPAPFDLFLASIGTCAGLFALRFCQQRGISAEGLGVTLATERDDARHLVTEVRLEVTLPDGFPEKYREALLRAIDQCTVKRHLMTPPRFVVEVADPVLAG
jgi:putative redox protein